MPSRLILLSICKLLSILEGSDDLPLVEDIDTNVGGMLECTFQDLTARLRS